MECHEGATMIKTFRGSLLNNEEDTVLLHTNNGEMGYRIVKFELMPGVVTSDIISMVKINKVSTATTSAIDFNDQRLLAAGVIRAGNLISETHTSITVFDQEVFNQDIYVNCKNLDANVAINYYIELEQVRLDLDENTAATLKDIRNKELRTMIA